MGRRRWCSGSFRFRFSGWTLARKDSYPAANDGEILAAGLVVLAVGKEASQNARLLRPRYATLRAARPDPSRRKEPLLRDDNQTAPRAAGSLPLLGGPGSS